MKILKLIGLLSFVLLLSNCASVYKPIKPNKLNYNSISESKNVTLEYQYASLNGKYKKKGLAKGVKIISVKISNNSDKDFIFGEDIKLVYGKDRPVYTMQKDKIFSALKQAPATHLLYLLLTPLQFNTIGENGQIEDSTPIGLVIGPGIALGNMLTASGANGKLKKELNTFDLQGKTIKKGTTIHGLIGVRSENYDAIKIEVN